MVYLPKHEDIGRILKVECTPVLAGTNYPTTFAISSRVSPEDEQYQLTLDDIDSCLVFMYTLVTEEGVKGEPQYAITDTVKVVSPEFTFYDSCKSSLLMIPPMGKSFSAQNWISVS
ncbi:hypothetical protein RHMOL_Rhmol07G0180500 [Rhododendron molle]|uniref:Uncharacterized protein n=1 Tax=Rhododendron molle TaxID=49168 RepID=A0ACC0N1X4_RHOML|nr:hypothetical protein RHMOL_Rhmol07G0180500 [Rhododendron molle]